MFNRSSTPFQKLSDPRSMHKRILELKSQLGVCRGSIFQRGASLTADVEAFVDLIAVGHRRASL